jgi:hypothetical protein
MHLHEKTDTYTYRDCRECDGGSPQYFTCPCGYCEQKRQDQARWRRRWEREQQERAERVQQKLKLKSAEAEDFRRTRGEEPYVVAAGHALHRYDCRSVLSSKNTLLVTMDEATQWLHDPAWTLPSYHAPRTLCGTCFEK